MQDLIAVIVAWLAVNSGLPPADALPRIEFVTPARIVELRYKSMLGGRASVDATAIDATNRNQKSEIVAVYDDARRTIYLPTDWTGATPAEMSVLVHEIGHHLQNVAGLKYECPQAREKIAYAAQAGWLAQYGLTLEGEFEIDAMTLKILTTCGI